MEDGEDEASEIAMLRLYQQARLGGSEGHGRSVVAFLIAFRNAVYSMDALLPDAMRSTVFWRPGLLY